MKLHRTRIAALVAATAITPIATRAAAQPAPAADSDEARRARARAHAGAGIAAHDRGDYDAAIAFYEKAYAELPHPALFFNMAQAHRLAGRTDQALALYHKYLAEAPSGELATQARTWIAALQGERARAEAAARQATIATPASATPREAPGPEPARRDDAGRTMRLAAYGTGGAALLALGAGTYFGFKARGISDELSEDGAVYDQDRFDQGESAQIAMFVCYGVGGALAVGSALLYVLGSSREDEPIPLVPVVGRDSAGVAWSTRF
jgi:tetratricopeptide (TPR) repeat protein